MAAQAGEHRDLQVQGSSAYARALNPVRETCFRAHGGFLGFSGIRSEAGV